MSFISTSIIDTNALGELLGRKQAITFDHLSLAMNLFGLNRIQPEAFRGQEEGQETYPLARLLDMLIVLPDPVFDHLGAVPTGVIPDQKPVPLPLLLQLLASPLKKRNGDGTHWASRHQTQPHLIADWIIGFSLLPQDSIARQGFGVRITFLPHVLDQPHWLLLALPSVKMRKGKSGPADLIEKTNRPIRTGARVGNQPITRRLFWRYIGSGLVIQCLSRF
ncbi:hypothetical protein EI42_03093 [Thermosporothrix hazakensis]|uniref:Uncharacterized protein n=1 Tax=Thermosporothrix hazakensis TaxID=644383 RepID=A0A326UIR2_THEHA|nr:hypothetical protein EI42_03093 [Thermosporothrix hazakensis]